MPSRREVLRKATVAAVVGLAGPRTGSAAEKIVKNGRLKQSVNNSTSPPSAAWPPSRGFTASIS
ncbi:MAG: twin-arginine translocation signal domain-containing protein [Vicinamibacteria bacterium]